MDATIERTRRGGAVVTFVNQVGDVLLWTSRLPFIPRADEVVGHANNGASPGTFYKVEVVRYEFDHEAGQPASGPYSMSHVGIVCEVSEII